MSLNSSKKKHKVAPKKLRIKKPILIKKPKIEIDYKQLFEASKDVIVLLDTFCVIKAINPACETLSGYKAEELIGKCGFKLPFIKNSQQYRSIFMKAIQGKKVDSIELEITHKNGETRFIEANPTLCKMNGFFGLQVVFRDITQHKNHAKELEKSQSIYHGIFEHTGTATIIVNDDMTIAYANEEFEKLSGYKRAKITDQMKWSDFFHGKELKKMTKYHRLRRKDNHNAPRNYESTFVNRRGEAIHVYMTVGIIPNTKKSVASILDITDLKTTQHALESSKKLFDDLVHSNPTPIYVINTDKRVVYWNKAMEELTGIEASQMLFTKNHWSLFYDKPTEMLVDLLVKGRPIKEILKIDRYKQFRMSRTREGSITGVKLYPNFNGQKKWLKFYIKPMRNSKNEIIGAIETISDITPEKHISDSLKNRIRELEVLYKISHRQHVGTPLKIIIGNIIKHLVLACDYIEPARACITLDKKTYCNLKKGEKFVTKIENKIEIMGKIRGKVELGYVDCIADEESFNLEYEKKVISIVADNISRYVQNYELIERHQKLINKSMVGIFIIQDHKLKFANRKFLRILRMNKRDLIEHKYTQWIKRKDLIKCQNSNTPIEVILKRSDHKKIYVQVHAQTIDYYGKKAILGTMQDISRIKKAQERQSHFNKELKTKIAEKTKDLMVANKRLQSLNKLKDEFIAIASHELRSPLTSAKGYLSFLVESPQSGLDNDSKEYLNRAYNSLQGLNYLVNNILDVSRIEMRKITLNYQKIQIVELINKVALNLNFQCEQKNLKIAFHPLIRNKQIVAEVDPMRMSQVIRNILENAIRYSPEDKAIHIILRKEKDKLLISIADQGIGIKKSELNTIFGKFNQTNKNLLLHHSGSGLGLFIAKEIIALHKGEIWCESQLNKGAIFKIRIPINQKQSK